MPNYIKFSDLQTGEVWQEAAWKDYLSNYPDRNQIVNDVILGKNGNNINFSSGQTIRLVMAIPHISNGTVIYDLSSVPVKFYNPDNLLKYSGEIINDTTGYLED